MAYDESGAERWGRLEDRLEVLDDRGRSYDASADLPVLRVVGGAVGASPAEQCQLRRVAVHTFMIGVMDIAPAM